MHTVSNKCKVAVKRKTYHLNEYYSILSDNEIPKIPELQIHKAAGAPSFLGSDTAVRTRSVIELLKMLSFNVIA